MPKAPDNRNEVARSYDQSVSNRAQKPKKRVAPPAEQQQAASSSKPAPSQAAQQQKPNAASDRRVVFKSTLDTPFRVEWPTISPSAVAAFFDAFLSILEKEQVAQYEDSRGRRRDRGPGKRPRSEKPSDDSKKKKRKTEGDDDSTLPRERKRRRGEEGELIVDTIPAPAILSHIVRGINHVTKRLESQLEALSNTRRLVIGAAPAPPREHPPLKYVLVCTGDVDPPALLAHVPHLVAGCNSNSLKEIVLAVPLPKGSEARLSQALGLPRASIVGINRTSPADLLEKLDALSVSFPILRAPWLTVPDAAPAKEPVELIPTYVKQLRTSAPRNMGAAKRARKEARAAVRAKLVMRPSTGGKPVKKARVIVVSAPETTT